MIYCCGALREAQSIVFLMPNFKYRDRRLEVIICPNCGAVSAELHQFNNITQKYEIQRPKRKEVAKFIKKIQKSVQDDWQKQSGSKSRAGFVYGMNIERANGKIYQYSVDFNGTKKLVKVI